MPLLEVQDGSAQLKPIDLYVSTPLSQLPQAAQLLQRQGWKRVQIFGVENRGRDIAPFLLHLLPAAMASRHDYFLKVHTKRSPHLIDGKVWSEHLVSSLLNPSALIAAQESFDRDDKLAIIAPAGTKVPIALHLHRNIEAIRAASVDLSVSGAWSINQNFIAGSMMLGRLNAFSCCINTKLSLDDFEIECGQTDGTLAHGLERTICLSILRSGWQISELPGDKNAVPAFGYSDIS